MSFISYVLMLNEPSVAPTSEVEVTWKIPDLELHERIIGYQLDIKAVEWVRAKVKV